MASEEQKRLADVVKGLHSKLRKAVRQANGDYDAVWKSHCLDKKNLDSYAAAMYSLAVDHWVQDSPLSRDSWCYNTSLDYFRQGGLAKMMDRQRKKAQHASQTSQCCCCFEEPDCSICASVVHPGEEGKLIILDVGSCFNPFLKFEEFQTVAVDLQPALPTVHKCDFLNLKIAAKRRESAAAVMSIKTGVTPNRKSECDKIEGKDMKTYLVDTGELTNSLTGDVSSSDTHRVGSTLHFSDLEPFLQAGEVNCLPEESFHIVVFSLLLSYFPSPNQRWNCCVKAHELLAANGLLIIVTPDSSHQNRNAQMIKSWKIALESIGFVRWRYVKQTHLHCMAFRKIAKCHSRCHGNSGNPDLMYRPQDFQEDEDEEEVLIPPRTEEENEDVSDLFNALPGDDLF